MLLPPGTTRVRHNITKLEKIFKAWAKENQGTRTDLTPEKYFVNVIRNYGQVRLQILLEDVVYKTEPMEALTKKKSFGEALPMGMIDNINKILYGGLDPKEIINGEKAVQEGRTRSLEEAFNALQS